MTGLLSAAELKNPNTVFVKRVGSTERVERSIRCTSDFKGSFKCNRLLTKLVLIVTIPKKYKKTWDQCVSDLIPGVTVKVGTETKCRKCHQKHYSLFRV